VFTFTPTETQGPGTYSITVRVTDNGTPAQSDSETITVTVSEVNAAPALASIANQTIAEGATLAFTASASDPDIPAQTLTYNLGPGAPAGAAIDPATGGFTWTPTEAQGPSTNTITVRITDSGLPALFDVKTFTVIVNEANAAPVLSAIGNKAVDEGSALTFIATATDSDVPAQSLTFSLDAGAPPGATITSAGQFTWTPTEAQGPGTNQITIRVTDNGSPAQSAFETISVIVREVNTAPVLGAIADQTVDEGAIVAFAATATDSDLPAQTLSFSLDPGAPAGASIDPNTGSFVWNTTESDGPGTNNVTIRVTDNGSPAASHSRTVRIAVREVNEAPVITPLSDRTVTEGTALSFTAAASDVDLPAQQLTFTLAGTVPVGASITSGGAFLWTPSESQGPGTNVITVRVTDNGSPARSNATSFTVVVLETNSAPVLTPVPNTNILEGVILSFTAMASDADVPAQALTFSLDAGAPTNASITTAGEFTWTPDESFGGTTNLFTIRVTDNGTPAKSAATIFIVAVTESNSAPVLTPIGNRSASEDGFLSFIVSASDPDSPAQQLAFSLDPGAPAGAAIDPVTGEFTWTPNEDQGPFTHTFTIRVTDNGVPARSDSETISITVAEVNTTPVLASIANQTINENGVLSFQASASDADRPAQTLTFTLDPGAPPGASITSGGLFTWSTTEAHGPSTNSVTIRVTDSALASDSLTILIVVNEVNAAPLLAAIPDRSVNAGTEVTFTASATDSDLPPQQLAFSLDAGAPAATIDPLTGVFRWTPAADHTPTTNFFTLRVTDSWIPALAGTKSFQIIVITAPRILDITRSDFSVTITWRSHPGKIYRVQSRDDLSGEQWQNLGGPVTASGSTATRIDSNANSSQRFYRVIQTD
ncbi:MAG TPA: putative Ig domain-containing protein, partial [Candidatus Binatia bacterium]|nr:putative Ig domain-containing protein [Candidatus Binatia bacterium]